MTFGNWCKRNGYLATNRPSPFDGMVIYKVPPTKIGIYTPAQLASMLRITAEENPDLLPWVACAAFTGARVAELMKLEWTQLNFERGFVEVASEKVRTKARRLVPMCDAMKVRHSYISYRVATIHDPTRVALEAGNSPDVIFQHYRELVSPEDAAQWFDVMPTTASNVVPMPAAACAS